MHITLQPQHPYPKRTQMVPERLKWLFNVRPVQILTQRQHLYHTWMQMVDERLEWLESLFIERPVQILRHRAHASEILLFHVDYTQSSITFFVVSHSILKLHPMFSSIIWMVVKPFIYGLPFLYFHILLCALVALYHRRQFLREPFTGVIFCLKA